VVERTADGRHIVVDGRRWRATDPSIPEALRQELVNELMAARRVQDRPRTQNAKVALGERGEPWWEPTDSGRRERLRSTILALAEHRAPDGTTCPSDAARAIGGESWRELMDLTREVTAGLVAAGEVDVLQKDEVVDPSTTKGPIRIRRASRAGS
jgi:hypothetical protein